MTAKVQAWGRASGLLALLMLGTGARPADQPPPQKPCLEVSVGPLKHSGGAVLCALFDQVRGFPGTDGAGARARLRVPATGDWVRCVFQGLPPGVYAVLAVHDENDNGRLDTNFFGLPSEGWAVSGRRRPVFRAPRFDEACFLFDPPQGQKLLLQLKY